MKLNPNYEQAAAWLHTEPSVDERHELEDHISAAIDDRDSYRLSALLKEHPTFDLTVRFRNAPEVSPLHVAVARGDIEVVRVLLEHCDSHPDVINAQDSRRGAATPLMCAVKSNDIEMVKLLCDAHADVNAKGSHAMTALKMAIKLGHNDIVAYLCSAGADLVTRDARGHTPLAFAMKENNEYAIRLLYGAADVGQVNYALRYSIVTCGGNGLEILLHLGCDLTAKTKGETPLFAAAGLEDTDRDSKAPGTIIKMLIDAGANVKEIDERGYTPLMYAAEHGNAGAIGVLASHPGADIEARSRHRVANKHLLSATALMIAATNNKPRAIKALVAANARLNARNDDGDTALMLAARRDAKGAITILCALGANTELKNFGGATALAIAVKHAAFEAVTALLASGADVNTQHELTGAPAIMGALGCHSTYMLQLFAQVPGGLDAVDRHGRSALTRAIETGERASFKVLLEHGANVNGSAASSIPPLVAAAREGYVDMLEELIRAGADINARAAAGRTALMAAVLFDRDDASRHLIRAGADVNAKDAQGTTALMMVARSNDLEIARRLVNAGADLNLKCNDGYQAIDYARQAGAEEMLTFLKKAYFPAYRMRP